MIMYQYLMTQIDRAIVWQVLELVEEAKASPEALNDSDYPDEFKKLIRGRAVVKNVETKTLGDLETEIADLYGEVNALGDALALEDQEGQRAYLKLKAQLISKFVELRERVYNMKEMKEFQDKILNAVDLVMTPDQRTKFMKKLES